MLRKRKPINFVNENHNLRNHVGTYVLMLHCTDRGKCTCVHTYPFTYIEVHELQHLDNAFEPFLKNEGNALPLEVLPGAHHRRQVPIQAPWRVWQENSIWIYLDKILIFINLVLSPKII